ncbi:MAG: hypothetical protein JZU65_19775 [Chlorobium sp.]|nr:hypothetical protein [Chlorobium sp.]
MWAPGSDLTVINLGILQDFLEFRNQRYYLVPKYHKVWRYNLKVLVLSACYFFFIVGDQVLGRGAAELR